MQVISRNPDRTKALGSVLSVEGGTEDDSLLTWAINQLFEMQSPKADAELKRFASEIEKLPNGSTQKQRLNGMKGEIERTLVKLRNRSVSQ